MKHEINKGVFWGIGVGAGISLIIVLWMIGIAGFNLSGVKSNSTKWRAETKQNVVIQKYAHRFSNNGYSETLILSGGLSGDVMDVNSNKDYGVEIEATIYNTEGVYLASCSKFKSFGYLVPDNNFIIECENLSKDINLGDIRFEVTLMSKNLS